MDQIANVVAKKVKNVLAKENVLVDAKNQRKNVDVKNNMKKIFIYYSMTGNGDVVSEYLKKKGYDIRKVISKIKYPKSKFFRIMYGGYRVCFNKKDKLVDFNSDISNYDEIVIGSPIWMDSICAPINSVLDKLDLSNKNVRFIFYSAGGEANKASEFVNKNYKSDIIILKEPKTNKNELKKL